MSARTVAVPVSRHALPAHTPIELIAAAQHGLTHTGTPAERYAAAHLAALRAASAVVAARARPTPAGRRRMTSVWVLLTIVAPELGEWAAFFAAHAARRSAAEASIGPVTPADANHMTTHAARFLGVVEELLGLECAQ